MFYRCRDATVGNVDLQFLPFAEPLGRDDGPPGAAHYGESEPQDPFGRTPGNQLRSALQTHLPAVEKPPYRLGKQLCEVFEPERTPGEQFAAGPPQFGGKPFEPHFRAVEQRRRGVVQLQCGPVEFGLDSRHALHEPAGHGRRGLECRVGHQVRHARVLVVPDARDDRQRELCDVGAEAVGVEAVEVAARSAAADQHHGVELPEAFGHGAERPDDRLFGCGPLHEGVEQREVKAVGALPELLAEVLVTGGIGARDDGHALYDGGHGLLAVHIPDTVALQLGDGHLPLPLHVAQ